MSAKAPMHPRLHFDRDRSTLPPPALAAMEDWAVGVLVGPHGGEVRDCIHAACAVRAGSAGRQVAVRDVAGIAASALRRAASRIHDVGREFGFDPTTHPDTADASGSYVLVLTAADFPHEDGDGVTRDLAVIAADILRSVHLTAEACAVRELMRGMIGKGGVERDVVTAIAVDAQPETIAILPQLWKALGGMATGD